MPNMYHDESLSGPHFFIVIPQDGYSYYWLVPPTEVSEFETEMVQSGLPEEMAAVISEWMLTAKVGDYLAFEAGWAWYANDQAKKSTVGGVVRAKA